MLDNMFIMQVGAPPSVNIRPLGGRVFFLLFLFLLFFTEMIS